MRVAMHTSMLGKGVQGKSLPSSQFCSEPTTTLKQSLKKEEVREISSPSLCPVKILCGDCSPQTMERTLTSHSLQHLKLGLPSLQNYGEINARCLSHLVYGNLL